MFPRTWRFSIFGVSVSVLMIVIVVVSALLMWALVALMQRTTSAARSARSRRTARWRRPSAVDAGRVVGITFFLGSALAGAAGVLVGLYYTQIDFVMGYSAGLKAFTAAVLGGIGNIKGAMLGGLLLGVIESSRRPSSIRRSRTSSHSRS